MNTTEIGSFENLLNRLREGETMEEITDGKMVECIENMCYEDDDLYNFLYSIGAEIEDYGVGYVLISTTQSKYYELPYEVVKNRFDKDLPDETVLFFEYCNIYDVTNNY